MVLKELNYALDHIGIKRLAGIIIEVTIAATITPAMAAVALYQFVHNSENVSSCLQSITNKLQEQTHIHQQIPKRFDAPETAVM